MYLFSKFYSWCPNLYKHLKKCVCIDSAVPKPHWLFCAVNRFSGEFCWFQCHLWLQTHYTWPDRCYIVVTTGHFILPNSCETQVEQWTIHALTSAQPSDIGTLLDFIIKLYIMRGKENTDKNPKRKKIIT